MLKPSFLGLPGDGRAYPTRWPWHCLQIHVSKKTHLSPNWATSLPAPQARGTEQLSRDRSQALAL